MRQSYAALVLTAVLAAAPLPAWAADFHTGPIAVQQPWARATAPMAQAGGAFMTIVNAGDAPDRLTSAATEAADRVELHTHVMDGGVMRMREVDGGVPLPAGGTVQLQPGGLHVMLLGLRQPLAAGQRFPLRLTFEKAGTLPVEVEVRAAGAQAMTPSGGHMGGHDMPMGAHPPAH